MEYEWNKLDKWLKINRIYSMDEIHSNLLDLSLLISAKEKQQDRQKTWLQISITGSLYRWDSKGLAWHETNSRGNNGIISWNLKTNEKIISYIKKWRDKT